MKKQIISIPTDELAEMNSIVQRSTPLEDTGEFEIIRIYTAVFGDNIEVDIKVCNGDPPFVDPVLFHNGNQIALCEVTDQLDGEYIFLCNGEEYIVVVE